ncbi:MAG TPA: nucleotidyl transferase AbiEii/AbiGii toxin family protein [Oligoflexia bacterium]|nr:nucleotidyl transferase AbiEii/AbiGii toxin family protein [Oligoflexia bacterium]HMP48959.1 nucleotidyl transferase AbiEii/AbiGii toxin family protein [Oligoflexia bacterium]
MSLTNSLQHVLIQLQNKSIRFALAGGLVANLYRNEARFTNDIDFAIIQDLEDLILLEDILKTLNLEFGQITEGDLKNIPFRRKREKSKLQMIIGRSKVDKSALGIDFLLSTIPWVEEAVLRAQANIVDYLDFKIPALTLEDMIIAKLYALQNTTRFKDLDDLEQFLSYNQDIDYVYLSGRMTRYNLPIPSDITKKLKINSELGKVSREIMKKKKLSRTIHESSQQKE